MNELLTLNKYCFLMWISLAMSFSSLAKDVYCEELREGRVELKEVINESAEAHLSNKCKDSIIRVIRWFPGPSELGLAVLSRTHHFEVPYDVWKTRMVEISNTAKPSALRITIGNHLFVKFRSSRESADISKLLPSTNDDIAIDIPAGLTVVDITHHSTASGKPQLFIAFRASNKVSSSVLEAFARPFLQRGVDVRVSVREDDLTNGVEGASLYTPFSFSLIPDTLQEYRNRWHLTYYKNVP